MLEAEKIRIENDKKRQELRYAYKRVFQSDDGKTVLADLRAFCGQDKSSVCSSAPNPYQTFESEGKRRVFLRINAMLKEDKNV